MAKRFRIYDPSAEKAVIWPTQRTVASGTAASIDAGVPCKENSGNVAVMVDADGTTSQKFSGIAKNTSTETASVAGVVDVFFPFPGIVYSGFAKSAAAANTLALIQALAAKRVIFDLTGSDWTVDSAAANAATNGVMIVGGNPATSVLYFVMSPQVCCYDNPTTA